MLVLGLVDVLDPVDVLGALALQAGLVGALRRLRVVSTVLAKQVEDRVAAGTGTETEEKDQPAAAAVQRENREADHLEP